MEWISVKDKLPEIGHDKDYPFSSRMILLSDCENVYFGQYENSKGKDDWYPEFEGFIDADGNSFKESDTNITHWMELPQPPKE